MKVALVHHWLVGMRGGERVLERLLLLYPGADIYTHVYNPKSVSAALRAANIKTTFIQKLPFATSQYQKYLPLMPRALEALDMRGYDLVISIESGPAKGVITRPDAVHLCYCNSPMRYIWDHTNVYRESAGFLGRLGMDLFGHHLRIWDVTSAQRVDRFVSNSSFIHQRVKKFYRRDSDVVFPGVDVAAFSISDTVEPHYLWLGQLTSYKRPDLAVEAFNALGLPLLMVGEGEMESSLKARARRNIRFQRKLSYPDLKKAYATSRGMIFTAEEDFGIVPVEMMASGRPVLAYEKGGALDTVTAGVSGQFFPEQTVESLLDGVSRFEEWLPTFDTHACKASVDRFRLESFDNGIRESVRLAFADIAPPRRGFTPTSVVRERA